VIRTLAATVALLLALTACERRPDDVPVVVSAIGDEATLADPGLAPLDTPSRLLLEATAQGLVRFGADGQVEPALAERWTVIDDGRSYIFRLREARWPDGKAVAAASVVRALRRATAAASRSPLKPFLQVIDEIVEMTPQVIEVRLKRPRPDLLRLFAQPEMAVFDRRTLGGSGPYRLLAQSGGGALLRPVSDLAADEDEAPTPEQYVRLHGERAARAVARFAARESDLVTGGGFADWPLVALAGIAPTNLHVDPAAGLFGLAVASREGFLADVANRAAIAMAIDRAALTRAFRPEWMPVEALFPDRLDSAEAPATPAWQPLSLAERRTAAGAQVAAWRQPVTLRIALPPGPGANLVWTHVASALRAIGIRPERVGITDTTELRLVDAVAPYDSGRWYLVNACQPCGSAAAALVVAARDAPTLEDRAARIAEADRALTDDTAYIPIAQPLRWSIVAPRLNGWQRNSRAWHPLIGLRNETR
jgi:peptide/nickel transport system substrate-binding protein